jgi:hypothetical protein
MKGYVENKSTGWRHAMKRSIGPGHRVSLDELFEQYGAKHELEEGKPFIDWLRNIKLKDKLTWRIVYEDGTSKSNPQEEISVEKPKEEISAVLDKRHADIENIVQMSVRTAREQLKKITDVKLLRYALNEANPLAGKDTLCQMLRKRIGELEITRR